MDADEKFDEELESAIIAEVEEEEARAGRLAKGAVIVGAAGAGVLAAYVARVLGGLSEPRRPFAWKPERGRSVLLKGGDVIDVKRGQVLKSRGVLFKDGIITDIISTRDLDKVDAGRVFDVSGLYVMPGLINCHVHSLMPGAGLISPDVMLSIKRQAERNLEECALHGVTTLRDASSLPLVLNEAARLVEGLEMLGPRVVPSGPAIMAPGGYPDFSKPLPRWAARKWGDISLFVTDPESARQAVRSAVEQGARFVKIFFDDRSLFYGHKPLNVIDDESVRALVDEAHRLGRRVAAHQSQYTGYRRGIELGIDDFEHLPIDRPLTQQDVKDFMKGDHHVTPTISVGMNLGIAPPGHPARRVPLVEALQSMRERMMRETCPGVSEEAIQRSNSRMVDIYLNKPEKTRAGIMSLFDPSLYLDSFAEGNPNVRMLYEAGATFCCGNDGGTPLSFPATLSYEMEVLELFGLTVPDILRGATINAAKLLDMESELGSLEAGKLADIVVLSADPLKDIRAVRRVEAVFRSGVLLHHGDRVPLESIPVAEA